MDQFRSGLEAGGVLKYLKKHYDLLTPIFVSEMKAFTASKCNNLQWKKLNQTNFRYLQDHVHC